MITITDKFRVARYKAPTFRRGGCVAKEKETRPDPICVYCKRPITREQRPSVQLENEDEVHLECYSEHEKAERRKLN